MRGKKLTSEKDLRKVLEAVARAQASLAKEPTEALPSLARELFYNLNLLTVPLLIIKDEEKGKFRKIPAVDSLKPFFEEAENPEKLFKLAWDETYNKHLTRPEQTGIALVMRKDTPIFVLDVDDVELFERETGLKIEELKKQTLAVKTISGGWHFYFLKPENFERSIIHGPGCEVRAANCLVAIPPSFYLFAPPKEYRLYLQSLGVEADSEGEVKMYEFANNLPPADGREVLDKLNSERKSNGKKLLTAMLSPVYQSDHRKDLYYRWLQPEEVNRIVELFVPLWKEGFRHWLTLYLTTILWINRVPQVLAEHIITRIGELAGDEELKSDRLNVVRDQYKVLPQKQYKKGWKGLREVLENLKKAGFITDEGIRYVLGELQQIFNSEGEPDALAETELVASVVSDGKFGYINDPINAKLWIFWRSDLHGEKRREVGDFAIVGLKEYYNPATQRHEYLLKIRHLKNGELVEAEYFGTYSDLFKQLRGAGLIKRSGEGAFQTIFRRIIRHGWFKSYKTPYIKGFAFDNNGQSDKLLLLNFAIPAPHKNKVEEALRKLDVYMRKWAKNKQAQAFVVLTWAMAAPFNYARKQKGRRPYNMLYLVGPKATGKSTDILLFAQGLWQEVAENSLQTPVKSYGLGSLMTSARIAAILRQSTFPAIFQEVAPFFRGERFLEQREDIKNAWDSILFRGVSNKERELVEELALATPAFVANKPPKLTGPEQRRITVIEYPALLNYDNPSEAKRFERFKEELKSLLPFVGAAVAQEVISKPEIMLDEYDFVEFGRKILKKLYKRYLKQEPDWLNVSPQAAMLSETETADSLILDTTTFFSVLEEDLREFLSKNNLLQNGEELDFKSLLLRAVRNGYRHIVVNTESGKLYIRSTFVHRLADKGYDVSSLKELAAHIGGRVERIYNKNLGLNGHFVLSIDLEDFLALQEAVADPFASPETETEIVVDFSKEFETRFLKPRGLSWKELRRRRKMRKGFKPPRF